MEIRRYLTKTGRDVFAEWLAGLRDNRTRAKIVARIDRLSAGNFGDCKSLRGGLFELRIDWGAGLSGLLRVGRSDVRFAAVRRRQAQTARRH
jgi:putative addiction module killer protein